MRLSWTSYLHAAPGTATPVIDEIDGGRIVESLGCASGWCKVLSGGAVGYLDQTVLQPATPEVAAAPQQPCFTAQRLTYGGDRTVIYCKAAK
jgi:hypothetical protein